MAVPDFLGWHSGIIFPVANFALRVASGGACAGYG